MENYREPISMRASRLLSIRVGEKKRTTHRAVNKLKTGFASQSLLPPHANILNLSLMNRARIFGIIIHVSGRDS